VIREEDPGLTAIRSALSYLEDSMLLEEEMIYPAMSSVTHSVLNVMSNPISEYQSGVKEG